MYLVTFPYTDFVIYKTWCPKTKMATAPEGGDGAELVPGPKKHDDEQTQSLEKVTDYVEEKETATGELGQVSVRHINIGMASSAYFRTLFYYGGPPTCIRCYNFGCCIMYSCIGSPNLPNAISEYRLP